MLPETIVTDEAIIKDGATDVVTDDLKKTDDLEAGKTGEEILPDGTTAPKKADAAVEPVEHVAFKLRSEKRAREALEAENAELKARLSTPVEGEPDITPYLDEYGNFKDAKTQVEYNKKLFDWQQTQRERVNTQKVIQINQHSTMQKLQSAYNDDAEKAGKKYPDFYDVVEKSPFTFAMEKAIKLSTNKAEIAYHICKNPELQSRLLNSDPVDTALEIRSLDLQLTQSLNQKKVSSAPEPINPVGGGEGGVVKDPSQMTTPEWMAWDKQRTLDKLKKKLGG